MSGGQGDGDPILQLESSHRKLEERLAEAAAAPGDRELIEDFLGFVERSVRRHEDDEEQSLFPRLAHVETLREVVAELRAEHQAHAALHRALREAKDERDTARALDDLRAAYARHIDVEETKLFPAARRALEAEALREIMTEMQARRGRGGGGGGGGGGGRGARR